MNFSKAIDEWIEAEEHNPINRSILKFLRSHCMGSQNAKSWRVITGALGLSISKNTFQQGLLKKSRNGNLFIGSNDHGVSSGYFLINSQQDAEIMMAWYVKRIAVEKRHLSHIRSLCKKTKFGPYGLIE
jgi:hypothetical protein